MSFPPASKVVIPVTANVPEFVIFPPAVIEKVESMVEAPKSIPLESTNVTLSAAETTTVL